MFSLSFFHMFSKSCLCCWCYSDNQQSSIGAVNGTSIQCKSPEPNNVNTDRSFRKDSNWQLFQHHSGNKWGLFSARLCSQRNYKLATCPYKCKAKKSPITFPQLRRWTLKIKKRRDTAAWGGTVFQGIQLNAINDFPPGGRLLFL